MRVFQNLSELAAEARTEIGVSDWLEITQDRIDRFADATDDHQWIHVDPDRARRELDMPTIAHGFLTLSLVPRFLHEILTVTSVVRSINYGSNKVRFTNMVPVGSRLRGRLQLERAVLGNGSLRAISTVTVEIEAAAKPALLAETITLFYE
jgi:acyl dehydratase